MKTPPADEARRCFKLRCQSISGGDLSAENLTFVQEMYRKYPDWYTALAANITNATAPYGSNLTVKTTIPDSV